MIKNFQNWYKHILAFDSLLKLLPGKKKVLLSISSKQPDEIIELLKSLSSHDTFLLTSIDVWRYGNDSRLIDFFESRSQQFYIATIGYENKKICHNAYELAYDIFWFSRDLTKFIQKPGKGTLGFGCLNRTPRFHRTWLGLNLWQKNLLGNMVYSLSDVSENADHLKTQLEQEPAWQEFCDRVPFRYLETDGVFNDHSILHPAYSTYCNIVTESETEFFGYNDRYPTPVITEKSWKPFLSCQIPLYLAAQGHMTYFKKFGLELFEHVLPVEYDDMNTFAKVDAILDLVTNCAIKEMYFDNLDRIQHNHELVASDKIGKQIVDEIRNFVLNH